MILGETVTENPQVARPKWLDGTSQSIYAIEVKANLFHIIAPQNNLISVARTQVYLAYNA